MKINLDLCLKKKYSYPQIITDDFEWTDKIDLYYDRPYTGWVMVNGFIYYAEMIDYDQENKITTYMIFDVDKWLYDYEMRWFKLHDIIYEKFVWGDMPTKYLHKLYSKNHIDYDLTDPNNAQIIGWIEL